MMDKKYSIAKTDAILASPRFWNRKRREKKDHDALLRKSRSSPAANTQKRLHNTDKKKKVL